MIAFPSFITNRMKRSFTPPISDTTRAKTGPDRTLIDPQGTYYKIDFDDLATENGGSVWNQYFDSDSFARGYVLKRFNFHGTHVYVAECNGPIAWGVRLGSRTNPKIPLREGMVLQRSFNWIEVFNYNSFVELPNAGNLFTGRLRLYVSEGPLVLDPGKRLYGADGGTWGRMDCTATTTPRLITQDYEGVPSSQVFYEWGRGGAILLLRNSDLANTLILSHQHAATAGSPPSFSQMNLWRLYPGESLQLPLDGNITTGFDRFAQGTDAPGGFVVSCATGSCNYDWMITRRWITPVNSNLIGVPE